MRRMLAEYIAAGPGASVVEAVQLLSGPPLIRLVHTKEGAQVACSVISYGTAKDRKKAIKGLAGEAESILKMAKDEYGHVVLLCILDTVDDTALLKKQILPEIQVTCMLVLICGRQNCSLYDDKHVDGRTDFLMRCQLYSILDRMCLRATTLACNP